MNQYYVGSAGPQADPWQLDFEGREWDVYPLTTIGVMRQVQRWVVRFVLANVELGRPDDDDPDPLAWRAYNDAKDAAGRRVERGLYGPLTRDFNAVVNGTDAGFAEAIYQAIRHRNPEWTRDHVKRLLADPVKFNEVHARWMAENYGPAPKKKADALEAAPAATTSSPSTG
jgi:hypothetical protein